MNRKKDRNRISAKTEAAVPDPCRERTTSEGAISRRKFIRVFGAAAGAATLASTGWGTRYVFAQKKIHLVLRLSWLPTGSYAPFYLAKDMGLWDKQGLDVDVQPGTGSGDTAKTVGLGRDDFGNLDAGTLLQSRVRGIPLKMIGMHLYKHPMSLMSKSKLGIKEPKDLIGKSVGVTAGAANAQLLPPFLAMHRIDMKQVTVRHLPWSGYIPALLEDKIDAAAIWTLQYLPPLKKRGLVEGENLNVMRISDWGFDKLMGQGFATSDGVIAKKADLVKRFLPPCYEALREAMRDPDKAMAIHKKANPESDQEVGKEELMISFDMMKSPEGAAKTLGWMAKEKWAWIQDLLFDLKIIDKKLAADDFFTNRFLG
jgi:NitT/TauT family transport system substrate-binding protein